MCDQYRRCLGVEKHRIGGLEAFLCSLRCGLVDQTSYVHLVWSSLRQNMDLDPGAYLGAMFTAVGDCTASIRPVTSKVL